MSNDEWNFKVDQKNKNKQDSHTPSPDITIPRTKKLELDLESAVRSRSLRVHAGKSYDVKLAGSKDRLHAFFIDLSFVLVLSLVLNTFFYQKYLGELLGEIYPLMKCILISYFIFYFLVLKLSGHSLGKKIKKIKIEDIDGGPLNFNRLFLREIVLKPISFLLIFPIFVYFFSKNRLALHDKLSNSVVSNWDLTNQS
jgi:uncharacterized RDD family membrane protein YckC